MSRTKIILIFMLFLMRHKSQAQQIDTPMVKAERVTKTASIRITGEISKIFPLFGPFEERKWSTGWNPTLIYPDTETVQEGTTFKTRGHGHDESEFMWIVSKYNKAQFLIQYFVWTENRCWTITINCSPVKSDLTVAEITYSFLGLNDKGNQLDNILIERIYEHNLKDWEEEINTFLKTGIRSISNH